MASTEMDHSDQYFRTAPRSATGDPRNQWLNQSLSLGTGRMDPGLGVGGRVYRAYRVARRSVRPVRSRRPLRRIVP